MFRRKCALWSLLLAVGFVLLAAGCSDSDRDGGYKPVGDTTDVTFRFNLDEAVAKGTVPCNVANFAFLGFAQDEQVFPAEGGYYKVAKEEATAQGQEQVVKVEGVPTNVDKFVIKYLAADDSLVAETVVDNIDLTSSEEPVIVISEETYPVEAASLTIKLAPSATVPSEAAKYSVTLYDSTFVEVYGTEKTIVPFQELVLEDIPLNLSYVIISWYDSSDKVIAATVYDEIPALEIGKANTITVDGEPVTTGMVAAMLADGYAVPKTATKYNVTIYDTEGNELVTSGAKKVPFETQYFEEVPTTAAKAVLEFLDANNSTVAKATKALETVTPGSVQVVTFDNNESPELILLNCYSNDDAIKTVSYTITDKDGKTYEGTTAFSSDGKYDIIVNGATSSLSVVSVVLKDDKGNAFEWFDYSEPQTGVAITLDTMDNEFANGDYVNDDTECLVANPRQLNNVRRHLGGKFRQTKNIDFGKSCGLEVTVEDEFYLSKVVNAKAPFYHFYSDESYTEKGIDPTTVKGWVPIGVKSDDGWEDGAPFTGSYDGGNCKISNLMLDRRLSGKCASRTGFFGTVDGAALVNINLDATCVYFCCYTTGSIVGTAENFGAGKTTSVKNCNSAATLYVTNNSGGIVGIVKSNSSLDIINCEFIGKLIAQRLPDVAKTGSGECSGDGGILGCAAGDSAVVINECTFGGKMMNSDVNPSCSSIFIYKTGGIIGRGDGLSIAIVKKCVNSGTMEFKTWECGGVIGTFAGDLLQVDNCQVTGTLTLTASSSASQIGIGGLVGKTTTLPGFLNSSNCAVDIGVDAAVKYVGGIVGYAPGLTSDDLVAVMSDGGVGTPGFAGGDATNFRGKYCGSPYVNTL